MKTKINAVLFSPNKIEIFLVEVNNSNEQLVRKKLESERQKIIKYLKKLQANGEIKSIYRPKNKQMQKYLDEICKLKKEIKKTINKLKIIYQ